MAEFHVINGGGGGGGGKRPDTGPEPPPRPRETPLMKAVFQALAKPAASLSEVDTRLRKQGHRHSRTQLASAIKSIRSRAEEVGWSILPVGVSAGRLYIRVLIDGGFRLTDYDAAVTEGLSIRVKSAITQLLNASTAVEFASTADDISRGKKRKYLQAASDLRTAARTLEHALEVISK